MGSVFNSLIEKLAYDWPVRDRIGLPRAGDVYTIPAWGVNQLYSVFDRAFNMWRRWALRQARHSRYGDKKSRGLDRRVRRDRA